jgi:hypothetical protein
VIVILIPQSREKNPATSTNLAVKSHCGIFPSLSYPKQDLQSGEVAGCFAKPVLSKAEGLNSPQDESAVADMTELFLRQTR